MTGTDPNQSDVERLELLEQAAREFLNPWTPNQRFQDLSRARQSAVRKAAGRVAEVVAGEATTTKEPSTRATRSRQSSDDPQQITPDLEQRVGISLKALTPLVALDSVKGFGPQKFKLLHDGGVDPEAALRDPERLPLPGKLGDQLRSALGRVTPDDLQLAQQRAARQMIVADAARARILTYRHPAYPRNVLESNNAVPILYARGDLDALGESRAVACVGSRVIRSPYSELQRAFAAHAAETGAAIVSGFALGADTVAHRAAVDAGGKTVCVMPGGLDRPFPPENKDLFEQLLEQNGAVFISEFPFGTGASAMNLRKRNKLTVAAAQGVLVGQSSTKGGAMNAFRFAVEQRKPVATFEPDGTADTSGNQDIAVEERTPASQFPIVPDTDAWDAWLSQLS